jgi:hypothetical protein
MFEHSRVLNGAVWQVMGGKEKCDVTEEELNFAISRHLNGLPAVSGPGKDFLHSVLLKIIWHIQMPLHK